MRSSHPRAFPAIQHLWTSKRFITLPLILILTSDEGDKDTPGSDDPDGSCGNDNMGRGRSNRGMDRGMDRDRSKGMGNNMVQDRVGSLSVHNIVPSPEDDHIGGYQLLYLD